MSNPLISVILCFYNEEKYIANSINSILNQTYSNFELILIDDNSTDSSYEICSSFDDPRIRLTKKDNNLSRGLAQSRNLGIELAKGDFVIFQDADDTCHESRIQENVNLLQTYDKSDWKNIIIGSWLHIVKGEKQSIMKFPTESEKIKKKISGFVGRNAIAGQVIFTSKSLLLKYPYRPRFKYMQDYDQLYRIIENKPIILRNIPKPLYNYYLLDKGVKNDSRWVNYNYYVRKSRQHRLNNIEEFDSIEDFFKDIHSNKLKLIKWKFFEFALRTKINLIG